VDSILTWLTKYSPPVVLLIALGGTFIFIAKQIMENTISAQFQQYKKELELRLQRRSNFEERVLIDRYTMVRDIHHKIGRVMTDLNRRRSGTSIEGLIRNGDIVPLTEVFEMISLNSSLITARFTEVLSSQAQLAIKYANTNDPKGVSKLASDYTELDRAFNQAMNDNFGLDRINWETAR